MTIRRCKKGFSIIEVTVAVAIIVIVSALFLVAANKIETSGKTMLTKSTIEVLEAALEQYDHYGYQLKYDSSKSSSDVDYSSCSFPFDLRDYSKRTAWEDNSGNDFTTYDDDNDAHLSNSCNDDLKNELEVALGLSSGDVITVIENANGDLTFTKASTAEEKIDNRYCYGHLAMIVLLNRVPTSRDILATISDRNIKRTDEDNKRMSIEIDGKEEALYLITDGWGVPLRYWYDGEQAFPKIESAGPDGLFDTADDVTNAQ